MEGTGCTEKRQRGTMATDIKYVMPVEETDWNIGDEIATTLLDTYRMGVLDLADADTEAMLAADQRVADEFDKKRNAAA